MHYRKYNLLAFLSILLIYIACPNAAAASELFYSGDVTYDIKDTYIPGEVLETELQISNMEEFPIAGAYIIIDIVEGCETPTYPSQDSDCDNIFFEKIIRDINIGSQYQVSVPFSYQLPSDLKTGTYRMDVYLRTKKTPIQGMAHIHLPGRHKSFTISAAGQEPSIKILRTKTHILGTTGPVGPPASPASEVTGAVYIENSKDTSQDLSLFISVCSWDDTGCDNFITEKTYPFSIAAKETKNIDFSFTAPEKPDAYAVRLEVKDKSGSTKSIYRSRLIVTGKAAKIRKLWVNKRYYNAGENVNLNTLIFGSPDHYTYPVVTNADLQLSLKDLNTNKILYQNTEQIPELSSNIGLITKKFNFVTDISLDKFEICAQITSENDVLYDRHCIEIDSRKFYSNVRKYTLNKENFDKETMEFSANLCVTDNSDMPISANTGIDIINMKSHDSILSDKIRIDSCHNIEFTYKQDTPYRITINDEDVGKQYKFEINSGLTENTESTENTETNTDDDNKNENKNRNYLLFIIFCIIVILAAILVYYLKKKERREKYVENVTI